MNYLVGGGYLPLWKMMEFVNGFRMTTHISIMENNPFMFQTTNQNMFHKAEKFGQG